MRIVLVVASVLLLASAVFADGDPENAPQPSDFLLNNGPTPGSGAPYCTSTTCRDGELPANVQERQVHALFNFFRTDPDWWKANEFADGTCANCNDILTRPREQLPIHYWYTTAVTAHRQTTDMVRWSRRDNDTGPCFPGEGNTCSLTVADFALNGLDYPADQDCKPNELPTSSMNEYCCFRLSDCQDSTIKHGDRLIENGFVWNVCSVYGADYNIDDQCGGLTGFLAGNTGTPYATVRNWVCDSDEDPLDPQCQPDCSDDECDNEADGRRKMLSEFNVVGGAGYSACANCEWSDYWTYSAGFVGKEEWTPTTSIASGAHVTAGSLGQGFMMTYFPDRSGGLAPEDKALVVYGSAGSYTVGQMERIGTGSTYWLPYTANQGEVEFFFAVLNSDPNAPSDAGNVARYPERGNLLVGGAGQYVSKSTSCDSGSNGCAEGGVCFDSSTCICWTTLAAPGSTGCTAVKAGAAAAVASLLLVALAAAFAL